MTYITQLIAHKTISIPQIMTMVLAGFVLVVLQSSTVQAQWATNGNNINNTNTGNVGIGTASPAVQLHVINSSTAQGRIESTGAAAAVMDFKNPSRRWVIGTGTLSAGGDFSIFDANASLTRMFFDTAGNVGIGTTSPSLPLEVRGNAIVFSSDARAVIGNYDATPMAQGVGGGIQFGGKFDTSGTTAGFASISGIKENATNNNFSSALVFTTRANLNTQTEKMRISSTGNVGIGMTNPIYSLDVNGGINSFRAKAATVSSNDTIATFENASGTQAIVRANGNVGLGTTSPATKLHVVGDVTVTGNIAAKYQDVAEWVQSSQALYPGTVVVLDHTRSNQVIASTQSYDTRVAGVISSQPGITLGEKGESKVLVATTGRVRIKVDASHGSIQVGDLLVTSDLVGVAMKSQPIDLGGVQIHRPGTLIGKALEPIEKGAGEILVLLSLQ
jgi:hypothetical protein